MNKKVYRRKFSSNLPDGEVLLEDSRLRILFRYDATRVTFIKSIVGARYDSSAKNWSIPRERYAEFCKGNLFPSDRYPRHFNERSLTQSLNELAALKAEALAAYKTNIFAVPAQYLQFLPTEVTFTLAETSPQLRARVKFASKAVAILTRMSGAHFIRSEGRFALPTESLADLMIKLRDKKIAFAVEEKCGQHLQATAKLRKTILLNPERANGQDLELACLTPFVDFSQNGNDFGFELRYATSRHLAELFPDDKSFQQRKKKSGCLSEAQLITLVNRTQGLNYPLYITRAVRSHLERGGLDFSQTFAKGLEVSEDLLPYLKAPSSWIVLDASAGLLINNSELGEELEQELKNHKFEDLGEKRFYRVAPSKFVDFYERISPLIKVSSAKGLTEYLVELGKRQADRERNLQARTRLDVNLAADLFSEQELSSKLFPHQRVAVEWLAETPQAMLGDDMGLGKTLSVLACFDLLLKKGVIEFALIICPNSLTRNWMREAQRFIPGRKLVMLPENRKERGVLLRAISRDQIQVDALVVNYERMRRPDVFDVLVSLLQKRKSLLCCDESQRVKNARSQTFLALNQLAPLCSRKIALTGTPTPRDITDIWSQVLLLDGGKRFGTNYTKWIKSVAELGTKYSDFAVRKFKADAVEETVSRVHELLLRRQKDEVVSLPEKLFVTRDCKLSGTQAARYEEVREKLLLRIGTLAGGNFFKQIDSLLEEYLRAVQIASNPRLVDENWKGEPAKFVELDQIVEELVGERAGKLVIWTNFLVNVDELVERYERYGAAPFSGRVSAKERDSTIQEFQNSEKLKILVAVPAAGGVGITLTAAQTAVYLDKSWNAEHWLQSVDRLHRIGQKGTVSIISLSACKIDLLISRNLQRKAQAQAQLLGDKSAQSELSSHYPSREELLHALQENEQSEEQLFS